MTLGIITGMAFEAEILRSALRRHPEAQPCLVVCHGFGRSAARRAALEAANGGADALLSFGIAGGLDPALTAGHVVVASDVRDEATRHPSDPVWTANLCAGIADAVCAPVVHAHRVMCAPAEKARLHAASGAAAVDMESLGVAEIAAERHLPFAALRAIADTAHDALPDVAVAAALPDGRVAVMKSVMGALAHPQQVPALIWLGRRTKVAKERLAALADLGLARGFFRQ